MLVSYGGWGVGGWVGLEIQERLDERKGLKVGKKNDCQEVFTELDTLWQWNN